MTPASRPQNRTNAKTDTCARTRADTTQIKKLQDNQREFVFRVTLCPASLLPNSQPMLSPQDTLFRDPPQVAQPVLSSDPLTAISMASWILPGVRLEPCPFT